MSFEQIPEMTTSPGARRLVGSEAVQKEMQDLASLPLVDYRRVAALKRRVLNELADSFFSASTPRREAFEKYAEGHPRLADYAEFRAAHEQYRRPWPEWPQTDALAFDPIAKRYHMWVQWLADEQLAAAANRDKGCGLYLDLPLGVNSHGYDVRRERSSFATGVAGGCPPDIVFPKGQNWGFVPLHPENIRTQGYRYVREFLQHQMKYAKVLRVDHVASLHRIFWIPPGADARDGVYVRYPAEELYAVFALESHRHQTMLVGEDLGTVPPEVPRSMTRHNFHRMYVVQYELQPDAGAALPEPPAMSIASVNTHDMPPFAGFWEGKDLVERQRAGLLSEDDASQAVRERKALIDALKAFMTTCDYAHQPLDAGSGLASCLAYLQDSPARMLLINLEDLWLETKSQNIPSTDSKNENWARKMQYTWDKFSRNPEILDTLRKISSAVICKRN